MEQNVIIIIKKQAYTLKKKEGIHVELGDGCGSDLVLYGHDGVVLGGVDVQDVVVVFPAQVVGNVGEGGAGRLGHAVVDDYYVIFAVG